LDAIQHEFELNQEDTRKQTHMIVDLDIKHRFHLETPNSTIFTDSWIGGYANEDEDHPTFLFRTSQEWDSPSLHLSTKTLKDPPLSIDIFIVGERSMYLIKTEDNTIRSRIPNWEGTFKQARVVEVKKSSCKRGLFVYCGRPGRIQGIEPAHWQWQDGSPFFQFSAQKGRDMSSARTQLQKSISEKWSRERPIDFPMRWEDPWHPQCGKKGRRIYVVNMASSRSHQYLEEKILRRR
jgi:hypothetical protein